MNPRRAFLRVFLASMLLIPAATAQAPPAAAGTFPGTNGSLWFSISGAIKRVQPDGTGQSTVISLSNIDEPSASADGETIAYNVWNDGVYLANADGTNRRRVSPEPPATAGNDFEAVLSPDGRKIAFIRHGVYDLYVMNADGTGLTNLTASFSPQVEHPNWSPDGTTIAVDDSFGIYLVKADGSGITTLPSAVNRPKYPSWSPNGAQLAYTDANQIFVANADGSNERSVLSSRREVWDLAWSPDGSKIAFIDDAGNAVQEELWMMNADGTGVTQLNVDTGTNLDWAPGANVIVGTANDDVIVGTPGRDLIWAGDGNDVIDGGGGNDVIYGEGGDDELRGDDGDDVLDGGEGDDVLDGGAGNDTADYSAAVSETTAAGAAAGTPGVVVNLADGAGEGFGVDSLLRIENVIGSLGDDVLIGNDRVNKLDGRAGNDALRGSAAADELIGGAGADTLKGFGGDDVLKGGGGKDTLVGGSGEDRLLGGSKDDVLKGGRGRDVLKGGSGADTFRAKDGVKDRVRGGKGRDRAEVDGKDDVRSVERFI